MYSDRCGAAPGRQLPGHKVFDHRRLLRYHRERASGDFSEPLRNPSVDNKKTRHSLRALPEHGPWQGALPRARHHAAAVLLRRLESAAREARYELQLQLRTLLQPAAHRRSGGFVHEAAYRRQPERRRAEGDLRAVLLRLRRGHRLHFHEASGPPLHRQAEAQPAAVRGPDVRAERRDFGGQDAQPG